VVVVVVEVAKDLKRGDEERNPRVLSCRRRPHCVLSPLHSDEFLVALAVEAQSSEKELARVEAQDREEELAPVLAHLSPKRGCAKSGRPWPTSSRVLFAAALGASNPA
jgi:hypothetical protein